MIVTTKTGLRVKQPFEMSPARAVPVYERLLKGKHSGKSVVNIVHRMDNGDAVAYTRRYPNMHGHPATEQRVAFFTTEGFCKWDMIA